MVRDKERNKYTNQKQNKRKLLIKKIIIKNP